MPPHNAALENLKSERDDLALKVAALESRLAELEANVASADAVTIPLSKRGENPIFFPVRDAELLLHGKLIAAAEAAPDTDIIITIKRP